ncbi:putative metalloprotease CJM1_0395 family protein [Sulfurimonas sp.]|uniref:putative metalloprotease CJM1_0395 family protein n=1 Tax=Sulfurimonas sp. TaxID=2022749 RepID=UPI003564E9A2
MDISNNYALDYSNSYYYNQNNKDQLDSSVSDEETKSDTATQEEKPKNENELELDEKRVVFELQARDTEVRAHEAAHQAAGGGMTGGANFTYERGPDGKMYAVGGEVPISMPKGSKPEEIISNAQQVIAAALAPADPSAQDMSVASSARAMMIQAQQEKAKEAYDNLSSSNDKKDEENTSLIRIDISA